MTDPHNDFYFDPQNREQMARQEALRLRRIALARASGTLRVPTSGPLYERCAGEAPWWSGEETDSE